MRSWAARVVRTAMRRTYGDAALQRAGLERRPPVGLTVAHVQARTPGRLGRGPRAAPGLTQARAVSGRKPEPGHAQARRGLTPSPRAPGLTAKPMLGQVLSRARFADARRRAPRRRGQEKMDKHRASAEGGPCRFVPSGVETCGRMGALAMQLLRDLAHGVGIGGRYGRQAALGAAGAAQAERRADAGRFMEDEGGLKCWGSPCGACIPGRPREARHERLSLS